MKRPLAELDLSTIDAVLFDVDGVITDTASLHQRAWKRLFDGLLHERKGYDGFDPFTAEDYLRYVDGKPRRDGIESFLASRDIDLPVGDPNDPADRETLHGLAIRKNEYFHELIESEGVERYESSVELLDALDGHGIQVAAVSSSRNCRAVLQAAGLRERFEAIVDGVVAAEMDLPGKPQPDIFLEAARRLDVMPGRAAVVEDARSGVEAGRRGGFRVVIGVNRGGSDADLREHGADIVVEDLGELRTVTGDR